MSVVWYGIQAVCTQLANVTIHSQGLISDQSRFSLVHHILCATFINLMSPSSQEVIRVLDTFYIRVKSGDATIDKGQGDQCIFSMVLHADMYLIKKTYISCLST